MILLRSSKGIDKLYAEALRAAGVDALTGSSSGYFDSREVTVMLDLLRVIDDPVADLPMAGVLLSPFSVFTSDDLASLRVRYPADSLYAALIKEEAQGSEKAENFLTLLRGLRKKSAVLGARRLIQYIYDSTDLVEVIGGFSKNGLREANLKLLLKYAGDYEQQGSRELRPFLSYLEKLMELGKDLEVANPQTEEKAVTVMTIHHSKGLEYPIVFLCGCGRKFNKMDLRTQTAIDMFSGYGMKYIDREKLLNYDPLPLKGVRITQEKDLLSEEMRLLYVAMTRAKEQLCIFLTEKDLGARVRTVSAAVRAGGEVLQSFIGSASSYSDWLLAAMLQSKEGDALCERYDLLPAGSGSAPVTLLLDGETKALPKQETEEAEIDPAVVERIRKNLSYRYPHTAETKVPVKLSVTEITHPSADISLSAPKFAEAPGFTPAQKGTIFHRCMQFADFSLGQKDPMAELLRLQAAGYLTEEERETVEPVLWQAFFESPLLTRILNSPRVLREYSFFDSIPAKDAGYESSENILIQGIADCVFEEDGAGVIVDFKTDRVSSQKTLVQRYKMQLRLYKKALAPLFPKGIKECVIYSVALKRAITV